MILLVLWRIILMLQILLFQNGDSYGYKSLVVIKFMRFGIQQIRVQRLRCK